MHTEALAEFHLISRQLVESLRGDSILIQLYDASREEWDSWSSREVFERSMSGLTRYARGLMESQVTTRFPGARHGVRGRHDSPRVVYRETTDHMGTVIEADASAAPTTTLVLEDGVWRVRENAELARAADRAARDSDRALSPDAALRLIRHPYNADTNSPRRDTFNRLLGPHVTRGPATTNSLNLWETTPQPETETLQSVSTEPAPQPK